MFISGLGPMHFQFSQFTTQTWAESNTSRRVCCIKWLRLFVVLLKRRKRKTAELEVNWPQASFVLCTGGQHVLFVWILLFCSWCFFISQRLCVNMCIWIKHIVCIYCLLALLVRTIIFHSTFTLPPAFLKPCFWGGHVKWASSPGFLI